MGPFLHRLALATAAFGAVAGDAADAKVSFNRDVRAILSENCFFCHGPDEKNRKAGLRLDQSSAAIVPGDPGKSEAWKRILSDDPDEVMPPPGSHRTLTDAQRDTLGRWIEEGAAYEAHWSFIAPERPAVPSPANAAGVKNPIDAFILARLEAAGLAPNPPAAAPTLLRRLALDLTGLPPTPEEVSAFDAAFERDPDSATAAAIDRLLASPHHGERMALPWLDAARYADSNGFQQDGNRHQWPWRDWVVRAYQNNLPFDRFTIEQLAGDLLPEPTREQRIATGFNRNHMLNGEGGAIPEEQRINIVIDRVETTATTWLALTMGCAQCHSHKYDPISHEEYFRFFAFFNNLPESGKVDYRSGQGCAFGSGATVQLAEPWLSLPTPEQEESKKRLETSIRELEKTIAGFEDKIAPLRDQWETTFTAKDLEDRTRFPGSLSTSLRAPRDKRGPGQQREITEFFLKTGGHGDKVWTHHGETIAELREQLRETNEAIVQIMVMEENPPEKFRETFVLTRGDYQQPAEKVTAGTPAFLPPLPADAPADRLALARWLVDGDHPLTARVAVNRLWQQFFGTGIVKTPEDFGVQGELPSHPELLDWLAVEFVESGWDIRHLVKLITTSATYAQDSRFDPLKQDRDPENRLLARSPRPRLPAMILRDQALALSGLLVPAVGGEPVYPRQPAGLWEEFSFGKISYPDQSEPEQLHRRSLYSFWRRTSSPPNLFDASARQVCSVKPSLTNTPLHSLVLLNDSTYVEAARALAGRMVKQGGEPAARIAHAFALATGRKPGERELQVLVNGYERAVAEFHDNPAAAAAYAGEASPPLAAAMRTAQLILNLDEVLCRP